eukprot:8881574-Pyramimonas_sp.AAC.1
MTRWQPYKPPRSGPTRWGRMIAPHRRCIGDTSAIHRRCSGDVGDASATWARRKSGSTSSRIVDALGLLD